MLHGCKNIGTRSSLFNGVQFSYDKTRYTFRFIIFNLNHKLNESISNTIQLESPMRPSHKHVNFRRKAKPIRLVVSNKTKHNGTFKN